MIAFLSRLLRRVIGEPEDLTWKPTGIRYTTDRYDYAKAKAGYERAQRTSETGRLLPRPKAKKKPAPPVDISTRRARR